VNNSIETHVKFGRLPLWWIVALRAGRAGVMARDVLVVIASYADRKTGKAWPSVEVIAEALGVSRRAVIQAIGELEKNGILKITRRNRRKKETNLYRLFWRPLDQVKETFTYNGEQIGEQEVHMNDPDPDWP
jgi:DNA-binding transcriptional ArsR family regulator